MSNTNGDYISRKAAKRLIADIQLGETPKDKPLTVYQSGVYEGLDMAYGAITSMRPADVRPVVTCEECKFHVDVGYHYCNAWCAPCPNDCSFFCAYGERLSCDADMRPAPEPPAETPAPICQTCGNFETCPWQNDPNIAEYRQTTEGRVVGCSDYKPE